jgi:flagellar protein FlbT
MTSMNLKLRSGEKLYINGAVIKSDRRVTLEILNDVSFLLEGHVLQADKAVTPLRQLYFVVQSALMDPTNVGTIVPLINDMLSRTLASFSNRDICMGLLDVQDSIARNRFYDAMVQIRNLYEIENAILLRASRFTSAA